MTWLSCSWIDVTLMRSEISSASFAPTAGPLGASSKPKLAWATEQRGGRQKACAHVSVYACVFVSACMCASVCALNPSPGPRATRQSHPKHAASRERLPRSPGRCTRSREGSDVSSRRRRMGREYIYIIYVIYKLHPGDNLMACVNGSRWWCTGVWDGGGEMCKDVRGKICSDSKFCAALLFPLVSP